MVKRIVVVFKTHFDLGFTDLPAGVLAAYTGPMFAAVEAVMRATAAEPPGARYLWTLPAWPLRYLLDSPAVAAPTRRVADALVRAGRLTWHAYPFTTHTAFCGLEDLVRGLQIGGALAARYGRRPTGAKQTDVPGHTWILPSLLVRAGVRFLHLGCNSGSSAPEVPLLFFWEGPDGARLLTFYSAAGYGTPLLPPPDWPFDTWLALQQTVDNHGPHRPEELTALRETVARAAPGTDLVFGELGDFAAALGANPAQLARIPVIRADLADTWIHGVGTMPGPVARARALRGRVAALESLATLQGSAAGAAVAPLVTAAYDGLLLFGEHTWGLDVKSTIRRVYDPSGFAAARTTPAYARLEASWQAKAAYVATAEAAAEAGAARLRRREAPPAPALAVYEPLGWGRAGWVEAVLPQGAAEDTGLVTLQPEDGGPALAAEVRHGRLRFPGRTRPLGLTRYTVLPAPPLPAVPPPAPGVSAILENAIFRLVVDAAAGGIVSLVEKRTGREWVAADAEAPFGAYRYDRFSATDIAAFLRTYGRLFQDWFVADFGKTGYPEDLPRLTALAGGYEVTAESGPGRRTLLLRGGRLPAAGEPAPPAQTVDLEISLYDDRPVIDLRYVVRGKAATPLSEAASVVFPVALSRPSFRLGQTGSVIDPARDIAPGANRVLWCVDSWVDASDDRQGLGLIPLDAPLVSLGSLGLYEYAPTRAPDRAVIYGHLFNTQWGTNFPQWHEGDFSFRYRLAPHAGDWRVARLWQTAWETTRPCVAWPGTVADPQTRLALSDGLVVLAVKPLPGAPGLVLRVWDALGLARTATIGVSGTLAGVRRCDLLEHPGPPLPWRAEAGRNVIALPLAPHAVETVAITFARD